MIALNLKVGPFFPYFRGLWQFIVHLYNLSEIEPKNFSISGKSLTYRDGHFIFGESETDGQHPFYSKEVLFCKKHFLKNC